MAAIPPGYLPAFQQVSLTIFWTSISTPDMKRGIVMVESVAQEHNSMILPELESQCYILQSRESNINPLCLNNKWSLTFRLLGFIGSSLKILMTSLTNLKKENWTQFKHYRLKVSLLNRRQLDGTIISKNIPFLPTSFFQKIESFFHKETDKLKKNLIMSKECQRQLKEDTNQLQHPNAQVTNCYQLSW